MTPAGRPPRALQLVPGGRRHRLDTHTAAWTYRAAMLGLKGSLWKGRWKLVTAGRVLALDIFFDRITRRYERRHCGRCDLCRLEAEVGKGGGPR